MIALHQSKNVQEASALALLQEAELECAKKRSAKDYSRPSFKSAVSSDRAKSYTSDRQQLPKQKPESTESEDKLKALMAFRKKNGLCFKCGEKWGHNHRCSQKVSLHVLEELFDAIDTMDDAADTDSEEEVEPDTVMAVGDPLTTPKRKTMKLQGMVAGSEVLILVDSGSVATFISQHLATQLKLDTV